LESWRLAPSSASPIGTPAPSQRSERFAPLLLYQSDSGRPPRRPAAPPRSPHRTTTSPSRSRLPRRTRADPCRQSSWNTPALLPLLNAAMRRGGNADPGRVQRVPPHPRTHNEQDRVQRGTVADARPMTAQRMHRPRRQQPLHTLPQPVRHPPTIIAPDTTHHSATLVDFSNEVGLRPHQPGPYLAG
jgi:hypothetical protein